MFAPAHHRATRFVIPVRRELAVRTIFNLLGPLTNPAGATRQLIGVADPAFMETIAGALALLGVERALVVAGEDGLDEVSTSAPTRVIEVNGAELTHYSVTPKEVGIEPADISDPLLGGGSPAENAQVTQAVFAGEPGAHADLVAINAGAAIYAAGAASDIAAGVQLARETIASGAAAAALERYVEASRAHAPEQVA